MTHRYGYGRGSAAAWHLIDAPPSGYDPAREPRVTKPARCGQQLPAGMRDWGPVCGSVGDARQCGRCLRKALRALKAGAA